ncbi:MAG: hypothetical protein ABIA63_14940, partial [bacterium]
IAGLIIWIFTADFNNLAPRLALNRKQAKVIFNNELEKRGIKLSPEWQVLTNIETPDYKEHGFVWQQGGLKHYKELLGNYLEIPQWRARIVKFKGDVSKRAEEYLIYVSNKTDELQFVHVLPESEARKSLDENQARELVYSALKKELKTDPVLLKEISVDPSKLPARTDWEFEFSDTLAYRLNTGQARINAAVCGEEISELDRYIHVPEDWTREQRRNRNLTGIFQTVCTSVMFIIILLGAVWAIAKWSMKNFNAHIFLIFFIILFFLGTMDFLNNWPAAVSHFSTSQPFLNQVFITIASFFVSKLFISGAFALLIGLAQSIRRPEPDMGTASIVCMGFSIGIIIQGIFSILEKFKPSLRPLWADFNGAGGFFPLLGAPLNSVSYYIILSATALFVFSAVNHFTKARTGNKILFSLLLILLGIISVGIKNIDSLYFWLITGAVFGITLLLLYNTVLKINLSVIPCAAGSFLILDQIKQVIFNAYPAVIPGVVITIIIIMILSFYWAKAVKGKNIRPFRFVKL